MDCKSYIKLSLVLLISLVAAGVSGQPIARDGILDLRTYDFRKEGILKIDGEWKFYWGQIIDPMKYDTGEDTIVTVPSAWTQLENEVPDIKSKGYASYRLRILPPEDTKSLSFRFTEVFSASGYYVNGKNIGFNGFPGANRFQTVFGYSPSIHVFPVEDSIIDLVVHVSNFEHRSGGIRGSIELGTSMQIMSAMADRQTRDFFLIGAFLIIGIYFMGLFLMRAELYKLFFSLICLLMVFRVLILSESDFIKGDWVTGISRLRLEYLSFDLLVPLFVLMIRYVFPHDFPKNLFKVIMWTSMLMIILVVASPVSLFSSVFTYYIFFVIFTAGVIIYVIIVGWRRGREFAPAFAIGIAIVVIGAVNDMLYISDVIDTGLISHFTMFIYLIIYAMIFSGKNQREFKMSLRLSEEISSVNANLENIVLERTMELNEKSNELMKHREELKINNEILRREVNLRARIFTIIGHDIKGPIGYSNQVLEMILGGDLNKKEEKELLKLLANSSQSTLTLLENLLTWGRALSDDIKSISVNFKIDKVIHETVALFDLPLGDKNIDLQTRIPEDAFVYADKEHVKLVIRNLLANAIKFTNEKGKILVSYSADKFNQISTIEIRDSGVGISEKELKNLFSDVEITSTLGTKNEKGFGIGLKLCKELVELNKGTISVESHLEKGSVFKVNLPYKSAN